MYEHLTVLKREAVEQLNIDPNGVYVDCTYGRGGHTTEILRQLSDTGQLFAFDQDEAALRHAEQHFHDRRFTFIKSNFRFMEEQLASRDVTSVNGILFDLGVSSPQFDESKRGFSYRYDAPLDMRMDQQAPLTAYTVVNEWSYDRLVSIFFRYGEEKYSKQIARSIESARKRKPIETTGELTRIVKESIPAPARRKGGHPAKRIFQAIRIAVNDELQSFQEGLESAVKLCKPGGRIVVITFHSLEDRLCKTLFRRESKGPDLPPGLPLPPEQHKPKLRIVTKKPITPKQEEIEKNRRARSAKLRVAEKR